MTEAMIGGETAAAAVTWFLETFITPGVEAAKGYDRRKKEERRYREAAEAYRYKLVELYGTVRVLGADTDSSLDDLFTDLYILDNRTARRRFNIQELQQLGYEEFLLQEYGRNRRNGMELVQQSNNLYILGKPGAGKTTFLKHVAIQAAQHLTLQRIPIFVSLHEWSRKVKMSLLRFITLQFDICNFPNADIFVEQLVADGHALILFDGLDEVKQEENERRKISQSIQEFVRKYSKSQYLITCRIAADEYVFERFRTVEIADFTKEQIDSYAEKWFGHNTEKLKLFRSDLEKPGHKGIKDLCNTPLLLSLICLAFNDNLQLGDSRIEIYENAIDALLRRWDASRSIQRDIVLYGGLRHQAKLQILAEMAALTFQEGNYFIRQSYLEAILVERLAKLPKAPEKYEIDGRAVLKEIEAQYSLFVERAMGIYSFSHLTLQEYFTAYYIKEKGQTSQLMIHLSDSRWREVFQLTAGMLADADCFFTEMLTEVNAMVRDSSLHKFLTWADMHTTVINPLEERQSAVRLAYISLGFALGLNLELDETLDLALVSDFASTVAPRRTVALELAFALALTRARDRNRDLILACDLLKEITREYGIPVGYDYGLYYAWAYSQLFARDWWRRDNEEGHDGMASYPQLVQSIIELGEQADINGLPIDVLIPSPTASPAGWQQFADKLYTLLQQRDLIHDWQFTEKQLDQLNSYFAANELLVQCLNVAVVSDRQAILAGLLAPPRWDA